VIASTPVGEIDHALDNSGNVAADPGLGSAGKSRRNHSVGGGLKVQGLAGDATGEIQPPEALRHLARHLPLKFKLHALVFARADVEAHPRRAFEVRTEHLPDG
jgi:hypothetical protein